MLGINPNEEIPLDRNRKSPIDRARVTLQAALQTEKDELKDFKEKHRGRKDLDSPQVTDLIPAIDQLVLQRRILMSRFEVLSEALTKEGHPSKLLKRDNVAKQVIGKMDMIKLQYRSIRAESVASARSFYQTINPTADLILAHEPGINISTRH